MMRLRSLPTNRSGASAVEFALVAPVLLVFILLLVEGGRMEWTRQTIQEVAANSARCMALGTASCNSDSAVQAYARSLAVDRGVSLGKATVTTAANQTCNAVSGMNRVSIALPYRVASGLLPAGPTSLEASACFPTVS